MKKCPHCQHELGFGAFVTHYGSDTLLKHTPHQHSHEHECEKCHARLWIHYNAQIFKQSLFSNIFGAGTISLLAGVSLAKPYFQFNLPQTVLFIIILMFFAVPLSISFSKYQSAVIKEEK